MHPKSSTRSGRRAARWRRLSLAAVIGFGLWCLVPQPARADETATTRGWQHRGWTFEIEPYGFLPLSLSGTATVRGNTVYLDADAGDVLDKTSFAAALRFEAWKGRFGLLYDGFHLRTGQSATVRQVTFDFTNRLVQNAVMLGLRPARWFEIHTGARILRMWSDLEIQSEELEAHRWFVQYQVGANVPVRLSRSWAIITRGYLYFPGLGGSLVTQAQYQVSFLMIGFGYRYQKLSHTSENSDVDLQAHGPYLSLGLRWGARPYYP